MNGRCTPVREFCTDKLDPIGWLQRQFLEFLPGKVCVVTGGGRGVGQAIAERYAALGFTLILTARSTDQLEEVRTPQGLTSKQVLQP